MRRTILLVAVLAVAGCSRFEGPLEVRQKGRADSPGYTIDEQERRARERWTVIEDDFRVGPRGYVDRVDPIGRTAGVRSGW